MSIFLRTNQFLLQWLKEIVLGVVFSSWIVYFFLFFFFWCPWGHFACLIACLQSIRAKRCEVQGPLLWNLSHRLASDPQWLGTINLPHGSWVSSISPNSWNPEAWRRDGESNLEQALLSLKLMSSDQQMDLLSVEVHVLQSTYWSSLWWSSGALIIRWVVSQWDKYFCLDCSSMRVWEKWQKLAQRWKLSRLGRLLEWDAFMPNLWPMHMTSRTVLPEEGDMDLLCRGLWWHCHARQVLHNHGLQTRVCNSYPLYTLILM